MTFRSVYLPDYEVSSDAASTSSSEAENDFPSTAKDSSAESSTKLSRSYTRWSPMEEGVTLAWRDVNVYVKKRREEGKGYKRIISAASGAVKAGSLVALMGTSGSGKSTLMAALAHRDVGGMCVDGDIVINGRPIGSFMRHYSGFMHQEDMFVGSLTVLEHMNVMSRLKIDRRTPLIARKQKVHQLLQQLGLIDCLNTRIGRNGEDQILSGGEKKRLSFATELLTDPPLLFCDEPTTGLDSCSAQKLVQMMNVMAANGKTIVTTIHQPSSELFNMFSQLILLADGRIAYIGSTANAIEFLQNLGYKCPRMYNPADFLIKTLAIYPGSEEASRQSIKKICDQFAVSEYAKMVDVVVQYEFHMGRVLQQTGTYPKSAHEDVFCWTKLYWLTYRWFLDILRNPAIQTLRILQKILIATLVGLCYAGTIATDQNGIQSVEGVIFMLVAENTFLPMYSVLATFPQDTPLFLREYRSGLYPSWIYYLSKIVAMFPGLIVEPVIFSAIVYWAAGLRSTAEAFLWTTLCTVLTLNVSSACGIFFSNAFSTPSLTMAYLVPFDIVLMVTSGVFANLRSLASTVAWTQYLSWLMYATESMTILQWKGVGNITCDASNPDLPCLRTGDEVLEHYSFSPNNFNRDLWCLLLLCLIFHFLGYLFLWRRTKKTYFRT